MQSVQYPSGLIETEFFTGRRDASLHAAMDARLGEQQSKGARLLKRSKIGRNAACPCGSGRKFKKCCIHKAVVVDAAIPR